MSTRASKSKRATAPRPASHHTIIKTIGAHPDKLLVLGLKLWKAELGKEACLYFKEAYQLAPSLSEALEGRTLCALFENQLEGLPAYIDQIITLRLQAHRDDTPQPTFELLIECFEALLSHRLLEQAKRLRELFQQIDPESQAGYQMQLKLDLASRKLDQALEAANQAVAANPNDKNSLTARLLIQLDLQRYPQALLDAQALLKLDIDTRTIDYYLAQAFFHTQHGTEALQYAQRAHQHQATSETHNLLAQIHTQANNTPLAHQHIQQAISIKPDQWHHYISLGNLYLSELQFDQADAAYKKALALSENEVTPYLNGISARSAQLDTEGARHYQQLAEQRFPDHPLIHWFASLNELRAGNFEAGWKMYEQRWARPNTEKLRHFDCPRWTGAEDLTGKKLLIHIEQGYGDFIQMCRYAPLLVKQGAHITFEVHGALIPLMQTLPTSLHLIERGLPLTEKERPDYEIPIMSLPYAFKTQLDSIPQASRYLGTLPEYSAKWQAILGPKKRPRIGLAWSGNPSHLNDHNRSISLSALKPLFDLPFDFHCLQHQIREEDNAHANARNLYLHTRELRDFGDSAALSDEMDLIITVDSAPAHLAGALGKPTWLLLPYSPDFRWLLDRADSPWYPSMVLFRQTEKREWEEVVSTLVQLLNDIAHPASTTATH